MSISTIMDTCIIVLEDKMHRMQPLGDPGWGLLMELWVRFPVGAGSSHTKDFKVGVVPACMVLMIEWGPRNITGRPGVSIM